MSFIDKEGQKHDFRVSEGDNLLDIAQANDLEMEGKKDIPAVEFAMTTMVRTVLLT